MYKPMIKPALFMLALVFVGLAIGIHQCGVRAVVDALSGATAAAWIQAVGSIAAIFAASLAIRWQVSQQQQAAAVAELRTAIDQASDAEGLVDNACRLLRTAITACADKRVFKDNVLDSGFVRRVHQAIDVMSEARQLPPTAMLRLELSGAKGALETLAERISAAQAVEANGTLQTYLGEFENTFKDAQHTAAMAHKSFNRHIENLKLQLESTAPKA